MAWLQLIRWKNLLIICFTQLLAWLCVIRPAHPAVLTPVNFMCLTLSTMLIAAAGYIINDYFDIKIDMLNRPGKVVLDKVIPRKQAIISHTVLNIAALLLAAYVALPAHHPEWLLFQLGCTLLLWFYSTHFKRQYMSGNIAVALLTALTLIALIVYEPALYNMHATPVQVLLFYTYFAFALTWMREIVKDMEDAEGDAAEGCVTMPVKRGLQYAAKYTMALGIGVIVSLIAASYMLYSIAYQWLAIYMAVLLALPLAIWVALLGRNITPQHYHKASRALKIIMILGISSMLVYYLQSTQHHA